VSSLRGFAGGEGQSANCATVKSADKAYEQLFASVPLSKLNGCLDRFGAAVAEVRFLFEVARGYLSQFLCQVDDFFVVEVGVRIVEKTVTLALDGFYHSGVIVTNVHACDA
jgi:hypothetical protein